MQNAYEARDPEGMGWRDEVGQDGPDQWLPPQLPRHDGEPTPSDTARFDDHRAAGSYPRPDGTSHQPAPDSRNLYPPGRDGRSPQAPPRDHTGHSSPPPAPASFDPQGAQRSRRDHGGDAPGSFNGQMPGQMPDRSLRERTGHSSPPPAPASFDQQGVQRSRDNADDGQRWLGGHDGTAPDGPGHQQGGERVPRRDQAGGDPYVERATPAGQQLRESVEHASSTVRRSVPLRTLLFVLPPLALPPLAFDLSLVATLVVALLLLWIAAAAGVFCTIMLEGSRHLPSSGGDLVQRSGRSPDGAAVSSDAPLQEALMAIGAQLDRLDDRVTALSDAGDPSNDPASKDQVGVLSHRPQEHAPNTLRDEQYDRYGQTAVPDTNWGESRWRR